MVQKDWWIFATYIWQINWFTGATVKHYDEKKYIYLNQSSTIYRIKNINTKTSWEGEGQILYL